MKLTSILALITPFLMLQTGCCQKSNQSNQIFPAVHQDGKTAIVAHRGYWQCEEGGFARNSVAALKAAQDNGFWGSECDIRLTADNQIIVFHDSSADDMKFNSHPFSDYAQYRLDNGEPIPTFDDYLDQLEKCTTTKLIIEFKNMGSEERNELLVKKAFEALKAHNLYSPDRVAFISFSFQICHIVASEAPEFINQYLNGDMSPEDLVVHGINGIDYHMEVFNGNNSLSFRARKLGISTNAWTVNDSLTIQKMASLGVDAITSDKPLLVRECLGERERKK